MSKLDELIQELCPDGVEFCPLEQCCNILDRKRKPVTKSAREAGDYPYYGANGIQDYVSDYIFDGTFILVGEDGSVITDRGTPVVTWHQGKYGSIITLTLLRKVVMSCSVTCTTIFKPSMYLR